MTATLADKVTFAVATHISPLGARKPLLFADTAQRDQMVANFNAAMKLLELRFCMRPDKDVQVLVCDMVQLKQCSAHTYAPVVYYNWR